MTDGKVRAVVVPSTLERESTGLVTGVIFLRLGERSFPDESWDDSPVVLLSWWIGEILSVVAEGATSAELLFMEGSYEALLDSQMNSGTRIWHIYPKDPTPEVDESYPFDPVAFLSSLVEVGSAVFEHCQKAGWIGPDLDKLNERLQTAKSFLVDS